MQFVNNGPEIPEALLQAHEEGHVVFFCGAGISRAAELPDFRVLVDRIYKSIGTSLNKMEKKTYDERKYDITLELLKQRVSEDKIYNSLNRILKPNLLKVESTEVHKALLELSKDRCGFTRLVTTNFDEIFNRIAGDNKLVLNSYVAPFLPIPKNNSWNGLVYLHGLLGDKKSKFVLTSGDFGLAYLIERWAACFISELFRNYVICFIGYSLEDPVMRYAIDALAAERKHGNVTTKTYAFDGYNSKKKNEKTKKTDKWESRNIVPILYEIKGEKDHSILSKTVKIWADTYRDGISGKEEIINQYAQINPSYSTRKENINGRMLWALSDKSGIPAKRFAEFNPVPSLDWLDIISEKRYEDNDTEIFSVPYIEDRDTLKFSLIQKPAHYKNSPWMGFVSNGRITTLDNIMYSFSRWLVRHLNDPKLILWLAERGCKINPEFAYLIQKKMDEFYDLEKNQKNDELDEIRANAPNAIPDNKMRTLWSLFLRGYFKQNNYMKPFNFSSWINRLKNGVLTTTLRLELRELFMPKIDLRGSLIFGEPISLANRVLALDNTYYWVKNSLEKVDCWHEALPLLLDDFQQLLRDALDIFCELGNGDSFFDYSHFDLPSISEHWQNRGHQDWTILIELLRDAWCGLIKKDLARATYIAQTWFTLPYLCFKRLALFAASKNDHILPNQWTDWLLADDTYWLWSEVTRREVMRLFALQGKNLDQGTKEKIESAILAGPPLKMYKTDIRPDDWEYIFEHSVWLRLKKLEISGCELGYLAKNKLDNLSIKHLVDFKIDLEHEREEFSTWMSGTGDPGYEAKLQINRAPRKVADLVKWLKESEKLYENDPLYRDDWYDICYKSFFHAAYALCDLYHQNIWFSRRWETALLAWSKEEKIERSWRFVAPLIQYMPDDIFKKILVHITQWLYSISKKINLHEQIFNKLCKRVLDLSSGDMNESNPNHNNFVTLSLNHPVGIITMAIVNFFFKSKPNDNDKLPSDIKLFFTQICKKEISNFRYGRLILSSDLIALFRIDQTWTEENLLPLLDWEKYPEEAQFLWQGFLYSSRIHKPLLNSLKPYWLNVAKKLYYKKLGEYRSQFVKFLTYMALLRLDSYTILEFKSAFKDMSSEDLYHSVCLLVNELNRSETQIENIWENRIKPFWEDIWPKDFKLNSDNISNKLGEIIIASGNRFGDALDTFSGWIINLNQPWYLFKKLKNSSLPQKFPIEVLEFLYRIVDRKKFLLDSADLLDVLKCLTEKNPELNNDEKYKSLLNFAKTQAALVS